jgi:hypothetical protein
VHHRAFARIVVCLCIHFLSPIITGLVEPSPE